MSSISVFSGSFPSSLTVKAAYLRPDEKFQVTDVDSSSEFTKFTKSSAEVIDATLFTHIFWSYSLTYPDNSEFSEIVETFRKKNKDIKMLLCIGCNKADECSAFASIINDPAIRKRFMESTIAFARATGFDGLNVHWEYPSNDVEMRDLGILLKEWRLAHEDESLRSRQPRLLLTAAVFYSPVYKTFRYPVHEIAESVDWVNLIFYNFYKLASSLVTAPPASLFDPSNPEGLSGDSGLNQWLIAGLPKSKAVFGLSYTGWRNDLEDVNNHGYGAPTPQVDKKVVTYADIRDYILTGGAAMVHDPIVVGDYCYLADTWIGYDDNQSIVKKVTYANQRGLRGYFGFHLGADYKCGLSRAAYKAWDAACNQHHRVKPNSNKPQVKNEL